MSDMIERTRLSEARPEGRVKPAIRRLNELIREVSVRPAPKGG